MSLIENIKSILECPVCLETPEAGHIYQCKNGHMVCSKCHPRLNKCPTCRDQSISLQSPILEKIISSLQNSCCLEEPSRNTAMSKTHMEQCQYQRVQCVYPNCQELLNFKTFSNHVQTHDIVRKRMSEKANGFIKFHCQFALKEANFNKSVTWAVREFTNAANDKFYIEFAHKIGGNKANGRFYIWCYTFGTKSKAQDYICTYRIVSEDKQNEFKVTREPVPITVFRDEIETKTEGKGLFTFTDDVAKEFWQKDKENLMITITLEKKIKPTSIPNSMQQSRFSKIRRFFNFA